MEESTRERLKQMRAQYEGLKYDASKIIVDSTNDIKEMAAQREDNNVIVESTRERLKQMGVQYEVNNIMEKKALEIQNLLEGKVAPKEKPSDTKPKSVLFQVIYYFVLMIASFIVFAFIYIVLRLYDKSRRFLSMISWTIAFGIYLGFVFSMHKMIVPNRTIDLVKVLFAIVPILIIKGLLWKFPDLSSPVDNTVGTALMYGIGNVEDHFKYVPLSKTSPVQLPFDKLSFDWLFVSLNKDNVGTILNNAQPGENGTNPALITNFYIEATDDSIDWYDVLKEDLTNMVERKRYIGHMVYDFIGALLGVTSSMLWASY
jgi:hypothetical protein